jgi:rhodanese-related sulfurtransferase
MNSAMTARQSIQSDSSLQPSPPSSSISVNELFELIRDGKVMVVDVRTAEEFEDSHIFGAKHLPLENLLEKIYSLPREVMIVTVSNRGDGRAEKVAELLKERSWKNNVRWLFEGHLEWVEAGLPTSEAGVVTS